MTQELITDLTSALEEGVEPSGRRRPVLRRAFAVDRVSVARFDPGAPTFEIAAEAGADLLAPGTVLPVATCSYFAQVAGGHAFREKDFDRSAAFDLPLDGVVRAAGFHAGCSVPVRLAGRTVGALSLSAGTRRDDMDAAAERLAPLGDLLAGAVAPGSPAARPARVLVVHGDALVGRGLARLAERERGAAASVAATAAEAVAAATADPPDVVVCDLWTAGMRVDAVARALREAGRAGAAARRRLARTRPTGLRASRWRERRATCPPGRGGAPAARRSPRCAAARRRSPRRARDGRRAHAARGRAARGARAGACASSRSPRGWGSPSRPRRPTGATSSASSAPRRAPRRSTPRASAGAGLTRG
jgi:CheY-like chemotaxis protein